MPNLFIWAVFYLFLNTAHFFVCPFDHRLAKAEMRCTCCFFRWPFSTSQHSATAYLLAIHLSRKWASVCLFKVPASLVEHKLIKLYAKSFSLIITPNAYIFSVFAVHVLLIPSPYTESRHSWPCKHRRFCWTWNRTSPIFPTKIRTSCLSTPGHLMFTVLHTNAAPVPWGFPFQNKLGSILQLLFMATTPLYAVYQCLAPGRHPQHSQLSRAFSHERSFLQTLQNVRVTAWEIWPKANLSPNIWPSSQNSSLQWLEGVMTRKQVGSLTCSNMILE